MSASFWIKRNDTLKALAATLSDEVGPVDLTGCTVKFILRKKGGATAVVNRACTVVSAVAGTVTFTWLAIDTATAGEYRGEFQITYPDASVLTVPNNDYLTVIITEDLA